MARSATCLRDAFYIRVTLGPGQRIAKRAPWAKSKAEAESRARVVQSWVNALRDAGLPGFAAKFLETGGRPPLARTRRGAGQRRRGNPGGGCRPRGSTRAAFIETSRPVDPPIAAVERHVQRVQTDTARMLPPERSQQTPTRRMARDWPARSGNRERPPGPDHGRVPRARRVTSWARVSASPRCLPMSLYPPEGRAAPRELVRSPRKA
jgi:hypothetical protein